MSVTCETYCMYGGEMSGEIFEHLFDVKKICEKYDTDEDDWMWATGMCDHFIDDQMNYSEKYKIYFGVIVIDGDTFETLNSKFENFKSQLQAIDNICNGNTFDWELFDKVFDGAPQFKVFERWS